MKVSEIIGQLEQIAPVDCAESWDNVGLLVGSKEQEVSKVMIALDASDEVIEQAVQEQVELLITHHPLIFSGMKRITDEDFIGRRVVKLIQNNISYYAMHTNCDACVMNDMAAEKIGLKGEVLLEPVREVEDGKWVGIGQVGHLQEEITVQQLAVRVKEKFHAQNVKVTGLLQKKISRVAISTGAGKSLVAHALQKGAQVLVTGDIDHHSAIDALSQGLQIIDAGHYGTERFMVYAIEEYLRGKNDTKLAIKVAREQDPFQGI